MNRQLQALMAKALDLSANGSSDFIIDSGGSQISVVVMSGLKPAERSRLRDWFSDVNQRKARDRARGNWFVTAKEWQAVNAALSRRLERLDARMPLADVTRLWQAETADIFDKWASRCIARGKPL